jgi:osmotically-inducible protein OsmY
MRALLTAVLVVIIALVAFSYWNGNTSWRYPGARQPAPVGTSGEVDVNAARARGAEVGEKVAIAADKVKDTASEAAITSKIRAKMVLDDNIKGRTIDITTNGSTVTLAGTVRSVDEHDRAVKLARETDGVTRVVDRLTVSR